MIFIGQALISFYRWFMTDPHGPTCRPDFFIHQVLKEMICWAKGLSLFCLFFHMGIEPYRTIDLSWCALNLRAADVFSNVTSSEDLVLL